MPANPNDGTQLGTAETIADESIEVLGIRREPLLPPTAYKLPRSKIAVGPYGQDHGDATADQPLQVESRIARQSAELVGIQIDDTNTNALLGGRAGRVNAIDGRGTLLSGRGTR